MAHDTQNTYDSGVTKSMTPKKHPERDYRTAVQRASRTCRWAKTMTAWLVSWSQTKGAKWHIVDFVGPSGCESRGIVDLLAVRKNHAVCGGALKRGDLLDIILIQVKGGSAPFPTLEDINRLKKVARHHRARAIVLSEWRARTRLQLHVLKRSRWLPIKPEEVF